MKVSLNRKIKFCFRKSALTDYYLAFGYLRVWW